ncbi:hypothetical protein EJ04DRAFT_602485 [Polyplosphaeria fusca]|uniref:Uncharacterized protein n=1 Tax=Polyplosphaeria fusca TaxID=682080 RepID=A0A9P4V801_9PLEO|nr:hypothetical protein EJ04DRAFT_602485 [Polyplosphaeria fusca]
MCEAISTIAALSQLAKYGFGTFQELSHLAHTIRSSEELTGEWNALVKGFGSLADAIETTNTGNNDCMGNLLGHCRMKIAAVDALLLPVTGPLPNRRRVRWKRYFRIVRNEKKIARGLASMVPMIMTLSNLAILGPQIQHSAIPASLPTTSKDQQLTWRSMNDYAVILHQQGKLVASEDLLRKSAFAFQSSLGAAHADTLHVNQNLARVLRDLSRYEEAESLSLACAMQMESSLGPRHTATLGALRNLAIVLQWQEKFWEALLIARRVLDGWAHILGPKAHDMAAFQLHVTELKWHVEWIDAYASMGTTN